jgi:hypothetical protein
VRTGTLDVADDAARGVVHKLDTNLGDTTTRAWFAASVLFSPDCTKRG